MTDAALRAYLLGKLTESEVELVENRLVDDPDLFSQMETAEDDLFDAYARGALDQADRALFLQRFGHHAARQQFARAFVARTPGGKIVPFIRQRWVPLAVAASLLLVVGAVVMQREPVALETAPVPVTPIAAPAAAPVVARISLALGASRAAGEPARVVVARAASQIDLAIRLHPADHYPIYAIDIRSQANNIVWADAALRPSAENGELVVHAMVGADRLPAGSYEVSVRGGASAASMEELGFLTIEVSRAQ